MDTQTFIYNVAKCLPGLLFAIIIHEVAHAYVAKRFGDDTAERAGRISMNPAVHLDMFGTVIMPALLIYFFGSPFGYAKPVPINPRNFSDYRKGLFWVSFAGPLSNFVTGTLSAFLLVCVVNYTEEAFSYKNVIVEILQFSMLINFVLMGFNLLPFPPLDGSKMLIAKLRGNWAYKFEQYQGYLVYAFYGLMLLSLVGVPILGYLIFPFQALGVLITRFFFMIMPA